MGKPAAAKGLLWKANFIIGGYMSLLLWNTVLNVFQYLEKTISGAGFIQMTFTYCFGNVLAFCTSSYILTKMSRKKSMNLTVVLAFAFFFLCLVTCKLSSNQTLNQYVTISLGFVVGYFIAFAQSKIAGIAGETGSHEIVYYNFGTGLAGVISNIFSYIFTQMFPTNDQATEDEMLLKQVYANSAIVIISLFSFWVIQYYFEKTYIEKNLRQDLFDTESALTEDVPKTPEPSFSKETNTFTLLKTIADLLLGLTILYIITINVVGFFNDFCYNKYDKNSKAFTVPTYLFFFNLFDTIGKFIPPAYLIKSNALLQTLNGSRIIIPAYFFWILFFTVPGGASSPYIRMFFNAVLGVTSGYFTSSFFTLATSRFTNVSDKGRATYFSILFLCLGVVICALFNLFLKSMIN